MKLRAAPSCTTVFGAIFRNGVALGPDFVLSILYCFNTLRWDSKAKNK